MTQYMDMKEMIGIWKSAWPALRVVRVPFDAVGWPDSSWEVTQLLVHSGCSWQLCWPFQLLWQDMTHPLDGLLLMYSTVAQNDQLVFGKQVHFRISITSEPPVTYFLAKGFFITLVKHDLHSLMSMLVTARNENNSECVSHTVHEPLCFGIVSCWCRLFSLATNPSTVCLGEKKDPHFQAPLCHYNVFSPG